MKTMKDVTVQDVAEVLRADEAGAEETSALAEGFMGEDTTKLVLTQQAALLSLVMASLEGNVKAQADCLVRSAAISLAQGIEIGLLIAAQQTTAAVN